MVGDKLIGQQLANFRIDRVLGRGGMGIVYLGTDIKLQRPVAIKVIDTRYRDEPRYARRFLREARTVATWRHEHITQVYYADDEDGLYYYVMEYVKGLDLGQLMSQYLADGELMPHSDVLRIGRAVASALDYAHQNGVIHRDVKPSNIMIAQDGRILLADFGLAMSMGAGSQGEVFGSPHYMAPEQAQRSSAAVPQSDIYSLGVIVYQMLTGVVPFDDPSPATLALQHIQLEPPVPSSQSAHLTPEIDMVLLKALSKAPEERYQTAEAFMDALAQSLPSAESISTLVPLPPLPAQVNGHDGSESDKPKNLMLSPMTVSERIALQVGGQSNIPLDWDAARVRKARDIKRGMWIRLAGGIGLLLLLFFLALRTINNEELKPTEVVILPTATTTKIVTPSATATTPPTHTPTAISTSTVPLPTEILPTQTNTPRPTNTATVLPTDTPTITPIPSPTVLYPNGRPVLLIYNNFGFYMLNQSDVDLDVRHIAFEKLDAEGKPSLTRFNGRRWSFFFYLVEPGFCDIIEIAGTNASATRPLLCEDFNARLTPNEADPDIFWLPVQEGETHFRVLWDEQELARCRMSQRRCNVFLPRN